MRLNEFKPLERKKGKKRIGRGGKRGTTAGRGTKGQKSRAGARIRPAERDVIKRLPKLRGSTFRGTGVKRIPVSVGEVDASFQHGETVSPKGLCERGIIGKVKGSLPKVKLLGEGEVTKKFLIENCEMSASAKAKIEKAGGTIK